MPAPEPIDSKTVPGIRRWLTLLLIAAPLLGCATQSPSRSATAPPGAAPIEIRTDQLAIRLRAMLAQDDSSTLVRAPGWRDYRIEITNLADQPTTIRTVKLRDAQGRYFAAASDITELSAPPDTATQVAGDVALRGVSIAAGQAIPYGGSIVGILSSAARANAQHEQAERRRQFNLRNLRDVELAPGAKFAGSAYLPDIAGPKALAIDWQPLDGEIQRVELPLPGARGSSPRATRP
jgi:hypothetical protein